MSLFRIFSFSGTETIFFRFYDLSTGAYSVGDRKFPMITSSSGSQYRSVTSSLYQSNFQVVQNEIAQKKSNRKTSYQKYSAEDRFKISKYATENGATAAVRKFKTLYPDMKESTVRGFKSTYEEELKKAMRQSRTMTKVLPEKKRGVH